MLIFRMHIISHDPSKLGVYICTHASSTAVLLNMCMCRILLQFNTHLAVPPARSHHTSHRDLIPMERRKKSLLLFPQHHTLQYLLFSGLETEFSNADFFPLMLMYSDI